MIRTFDYGAVMKNVSITGELKSSFPLALMPISWMTFFMGVSIRETMWKLQKIKKKKDFKTTISSTIGDVQNLVMLY